MTTYPDPEVLGAVVPVDLCCALALPAHGEAGRCQLWAGHCGEHAVMLVRDGERVVCTWSGAGVGVVCDCADFRSLPWARGFPVPAWRESGDEPE